MAAVGTARKPTAKNVLRLTLFVARKHRGGDGMKIKQASYVDKIYKWWYMEKYSEYPPKYVNLCPYLRAILFWAPLRFLFLCKFAWVRVPLLGVVLGAIESVALATSIYVYSLPSPEMFTGSLFLLQLFVLIWFTGHMFLFIAFFVWLTNEHNLERRFLESAPAKLVDEIVALVEEKAKAAHENICPTIEREL